MGGRLQILTYTRHSWSLNSEGSSACHIYCNTGHPFKMVISHDPWHSHLFLKYMHEIKRYVNMQVMQNRTCTIMLTNCLKTHRLATSNWKKSWSFVFFSYRNGLFIQSFISLYSPQCASCVLMWRCPGANNR